MILMSTEEYTELEEMEDESMREDEHWLRKFITAEWKLARARKFNKTKVTPLAEMY